MGGFKNLIYIAKVLNLSTSMYANKQSIIRTGYSVIIGFWLLSFSSFGQADVTVGKPYAVVDAQHKFYFYKGKEILTVKLTKNSVILQKLNADNLLFQKTKLYDDIGKGYQLENVLNFAGRYYLFYSKEDGDVEQMFAREINFKEGTFFTAAVELLRVNHRISGDPMQVYRQGVYGKYSFTLSGDSSTLLIQYRMKPDVKRDSKNYDIIGFNVYDGKMKNLWSKEVTMPYTEKKMDILDYTVDRSGNAYATAKVYEDENREKEKEDENAPNYAIELLKISAKTQTLSKHPVAVPNKFLQSLRLFESPKGDLVGAGFYNLDSKRRTADGVFFFNISKEMKVSNTATHEIPISLLNQNASAKTQRKNERKEDKDKAELENIYLDHVSIEADGSMLLVAEQFFITTRTTYSSTGGSTTTYIYNYNDMWITKISAAGKLLWMKKLPKLQQGGGPGGMSYHFFRTKESYNLIFIDNKKNIKLTPDKTPARHIDGLGGFLTAYQVNVTSGEVSKALLLDTDDVKGMEIYQFTTKRIIATGPREFVFEAYKKKKEDVLIKVKL